MARVKYGAIVTELKGKYSGGVFQKCGNTTSLRSLPSKLECTKPLVLNSRNKFRNLSNFWRHLSVAEKQAFSDAAPTYPTYNNFDQRVTLSGYQLFMYINRRFQLAELELIDECPAYAPPQFEGGIYDPFSIQSHEFLFTVDSVTAADISLLVYASQQLPPTSIYRPQNLRFVGKLPDVTVGTYNLYNMIVNNFDVAMAVGSIFWLYIYSVQPSTGQVTFQFDDFTTIYN